MESVFAALTGVALALLLGHFVVSRRASQRQAAGRLLCDLPGRRGPAKGRILFWLAAAILTLVFVQLFLFFNRDYWGTFILPPDGSGGSGWLSLVGSFSVCYLVVLGLLWDTRGELREYGLILPSATGQRFIPWTQVSDWQPLETGGFATVLAAGPTISVPVASDQAEVAIVILHKLFESRDKNDETLAAAQEPVADHVSARRFLFSVKTLLLLVLLAGAAFGWRGVCIRYAESEDAAVARLHEVGYDLLRRDGRITSLWPDFKQSGTLLDDDLHLVSRFRELEALEVRGSHVTDAGLAYLEDLTSLKHLDLSGTGITDAGLVHLRNLTNLESLNLSGTGINGNGLVHLKSLRNLRKLYLRSPRITGRSLVHLADLKELQTLQLNYTRVDDQGLAYLGNLPNLKELHLIRTSVTGRGLAHLAGSKRLSNLWLSFCPIADNDLADIKALNALPELSLHLGCTPITDKGIAYVGQLTNLKRLYVDRTKISDASIPHLGNLKQLEYLIIWGTDVTKQGIDRLQKDLPNTKIRH